MTQSFAPVVRLPPPAVATTDVVVEPPPGLPPPTSPRLLPRLLPVAMSVATLGVMAAAFFSGAGVTRNPVFLAFPVMMLVSMAVTVVTGRGRQRGDGIDADRVNFLGYLSRLRGTVTETAAAQRLSLVWSHPDPDTLWTLVGGPRMWERRVSDSDFCLVRAGVGTRSLATRLVAPDPTSQEPSDPVTATALRRFLRAHSTIADAPIVIGLRGIATVTADGDLASVRGLLRAMICQLAVLHPPDQLLIAAATSDRNLAHWDWLKWLPHSKHPTAADAL
ncbi:MAG TPA: type VII secretion protein EccC, partial [Mycobacterium sp.]|nr:type VII secretion protein EccC [Mycobacterium sp.]